MPQPNWNCCLWNNSLGIWRVRNRLDALACNQAAINGQTWRNDKRLHGEHCNEWLLSFDWPHQDYNTTPKLWSEFTLSCPVYGLHKNLLWVHLWPVQNSRHKILLVVGFIVAEFALYVSICMFLIRSDRRIASYLSNHAIKGRKRRNVITLVGSMINFAFEVTLLSMPTWILPLLARVCKTYFPPSK